MSKLVNQHPLHHHKQARVTQNNLVQVAQRAAAARGLVTVRQVTVMVLHPQGTPKSLRVIVRRKERGTLTTKVKVMVRCQIHQRK